MHTAITLTPEQAASHERLYAQWLLTLQAQAADNSDPETQANARLLLANRKGK